MTRTHGLGISIVWILISAAAATAGIQAAEEARPLAKADEPPRIDGVLDDPVWLQAAPWTDFKTAKPDYGKPASEKTEMFAAYDRENLYVAFRCSDSDPAGIKTSIARRDAIDSDDWTGVILDTFDDQQSGYIFVVNPQGIQMDGTLDQNGNGNADFDTVWSSAGKVSNGGYTTEIAIPFKSIRYPFRKILTMGVMGARVIVRKSEQDHFPEFAPDRGSMLAQLHRVTLSDVKYERIVEILPATTFSQAHAARAGSWARESRQTEFSLTGKLGITSDLTLDAAYNPDFSQVETDAGQVDVNLRSSLYYSEKRPFFLEGKDHFTFAGVMEADPLQTIVHTRNIVDPALGFKLTGKVGSRNLVSSIFALDEFPGHEGLSPGDAGAAGRDAAFTILRYKRTLRQDSFMGGFYAGREFAGDYNRVAGADGRLRLSQTSLLEYHAFGSLSRDHDALDASAGSAVGLRYTYSSRQLNIEAGFSDISRNFRTDTGYLTRAGVTMLPGLLLYTFYPKSKFIQKIEPFYWGFVARDRYCGLWENANIFALRLGMPRQSELRFDAIAGNEVFADRRFSISAWRIRGYSQIVKQLYFEFSFRRGHLIYYDADDPFQGKGDRASLSVIFQPLEKLSSSLDLQHENLRREAGGETVYDYTVVRDRTTFQFNKYLFLRGIAEYNFYWKKLNLDVLASFTYIPGTVIYVGYGSVAEKVYWNGEEYLAASRFQQTRGSFFFKASYLWRI